MGLTYGPYACTGAYIQDILGLVYRSKMEISSKQEPPHVVLQIFLLGQSSRGLGVEAPILHTKTVLFVLCV